MSSASGDAYSGWVGRRVLVTGATGMVGSWLSRRLVDAGADVVALIIDHDPRSELIRSGTINRLSVVSGDLQCFRDVERAVSEKEVDSVFHLGARTVVGHAHAYPIATFESNIQGTWNLLEACRLHSRQIERIVVASSDKVYGDQPLPYREAMPLDPLGLYAVSKACADTIAQGYRRSYNLPVGIARCGNIYGGGDLNWSRIVPGTLRSLHFGQSPIIRSDGKYLRDYLFVEDIVDAYVRLAAAVDSESCGLAYNFGSDAPLTVLELYDTICRVAGSSIEPKILDTAVDEIRDQHLDAQQAHADLGWSPRYSIEEGLSATRDWYQRFFESTYTSPD